VVATHQVDEIQHVLTDVMFIDRGRIVFARRMEEVESRYREVMVNPDKLAAARALKPIQERQGFGRSILLFDGLDRAQLATLGEVRTPSIADLFVAVMSNDAGRARGAAEGTRKRTARHRLIATRRRASAPPLQGRSAGAGRGAG